MKSTSVFISIGRGTCVDEDALAKCEVGLARNQLQSEYAHVSRVAAVARKVLQQKQIAGVPTSDGVTCAWESPLLLATWLQTGIRMLFCFCWISLQKPFACAFARVYVRVVWKTSLGFGRRCLGRVCCRAAAAGDTLCEQVTS
eukprot:2642747-Amphidinium_carterae.1